MDIPSFETQHQHRINTMNKYLFDNHIPVPSIWLTMSKAERDAWTANTYITVKELNNMDIK